MRLSTFFYFSLVVSCKPKSNPSAPVPAVVPVAAPEVKKPDLPQQKPFPVTLLDPAEEYLGCALAPQPDAQKTATFKNKKIQYFSASEIGYQSNDWWAAGDKKWISYQGLDAKDLGDEGWEGGRNFAPPGKKVNVRMAAIDVRNINGVLHYHYFSNGTGRSNIENWSSTKVLAILMAGHEMRRTSGGLAGLDAKVYQNQSNTVTSSWIGDHIAELAINSTNPRAVWFKSIVGAREADNFAKNWLATNIEYGSGYGVAAEKLGAYVRQRDIGPFYELKKTKDWRPFGSNSVMPLAMAEFWKRVTLNSQEPSTWLKNADYGAKFVSDSSLRNSLFFMPFKESAIRPEDLKAFLYGSNLSKTKMGMRQLDDPSGDFVDRTTQALGGTDRLAKLTAGRFRIFGKLGFGEGESGERAGVPERIMGGAVCLPFQANNASANKFGRLVSFFINVQNVSDDDPVTGEDTVDRVVRNMGKVLLHFEDQGPFDAATMLLP